MNNKKIFFPRPLQDVLAGRAKVRGTEQGNNLIIYPSSVCWNFVPQTTSPARGEDKRQGGFTLIELLVVVLIIGILAAVAVPQYQKAVEKSRAAQALSVLSTLYQAAEAKQLASGKWPASADDLDIEIPQIGDGKDWQIWFEAGSCQGVGVTRERGKYKHTYFAKYKKHTLAEAGVPLDKIFCAEQSNLVSFSEGDYCQKLFGGKRSYKNSAVSIWSLP